MIMDRTTAIVRTNIGGKVDWRTSTLSESRMIRPSDVVLLVERVCTV